MRSMEIGIITGSYRFPVRNMEDHSQPCNSFVKEEPIDFFDGVTTVKQDDANSHKDSKSPFHNQGKIKTRSTTTDHTYQYHVTVKEESTQFASVNYATSGDQIKFNCSETHSPDPDAPDLYTTLKIEEMNMADFKTGEHTYEKGTSFNARVQTQNLQHVGQRHEARKRTRSIPSPATMMKIAKNYANLYSDKVRHPSPYPRFTSSTVIQCPTCTTPRDQSRHSAFLELLLHVMKRHCDCSDSVFHEIGWTYRSYIEGLKMKICKKLKKRHSSRIEQNLLRANK